MFRWVYFAVCLLALCAWLVVSSPTGRAANEQHNGQSRRVSTATAAFNTGDVFAAVGNGKVKRFSPTGTLLQILDSGSNSQDTAGMAFDPVGNLYSTQFTSNQVFKFDINGNLLGAFGSGLDAHPESIVIDKAQNFYIGHANGTRLMRKFNAAGTLLDTYALATEDRGSDWIDLAADQRTLFYTSEGKQVKRYDVVSKTQLPDFSTAPLTGSYAYALRILPGGGVIVADTQTIVRLDSSGNLVQTYDAPNEDNWFAVNLDPDGQTFWSGNLGTGKVYRFNIATGALLTSWDSGKFTSLSGLAVFGEITASQILRITKSAPATVAAGAQLTYTLSCGNTGTTNATSVVIKDTVPTGTSFVSATDGGSLANGIVTWNLSTLNAGVTGRTVSFTVSVSSVLANGATLTNSNYSIEASGVAAVTGPPVTTTIGGGGSSMCEYTVAPLTQAFSAAGGTGTINVATSTDCGWTATRSSAWMSVTAGSSGTGNGTVTYTVQANTSPSARVGGLLVAGRYVLITQAGSLGNCPVTPLTIPQTVNATLSSTDCRSVVDENAYADLYSFSGQAGQRIAIAQTTTAFDAYLVLIAENGSIIGSNDDSDSSTTSSRIPPGSGFYVLPYTGTYIIEASSFNVDETGSYTLSLTAATGGPACSYALTPTLAAFNAAGGAGTVTMAAPVGCEWTASALSSWIGVNSAASGSGNGTINYTVSGNASQGFRVGRLVIGGQFVTVVQGGTGGNCPITPVGVPSATDAAWAVGDCASGSGGFSDLYSFTGQAGQRVSIETVTQATTTGLYLYGPTGSFVVGYIGDATLRIPPGTGYYVLPYTGTYLIEANAGTAGNYTLNLNVPAVTPTCPAISGFTPASGAAGSTVTIIGNNFTGVTAVKFANNVNAQFTINSNTQITATVPNSAVTGVLTFSKANCADVQTSSAFTVTTSTVAELIDHAITGGPIPAECSPPPVKSNFAPTDERAYQWSSFVNVRQGDIVRWEFVQPNGAVYDTQQRTSDYNGASCFWAWVTIAGQPAASLPGDWQVRVSYNGTPILTERFRILPGTSNCPTVTSLSAAAGVTGSTITLTGANFTGVTAVKFANNVTAQFTINSDTSLTTTVPNGAVTGPITLSKASCGDTNTGIFIVLGGGGNCVQPPAGLLAWWPGDGNANDIQGTNNGTAQTGATFTDGKVGQAFNFDGASATVATSNTTLNGAYTALTIDAWVYPLSHGQRDGYGRTVLSKTDGDGFSLLINDGFIQPVLRLTTSGEVRPVFNQMAEWKLALNTWSHVTITWDGALLKAYLNGQQLGSGSAATGTIRNTANANTCLMIGNEPIQPCNIESGYGFHGRLDEIEVFDRALSAAEVQAIFNADSAGKCKTTPGNCVTAPSGAIAWLPGDGTATDLTGMHNGTLQNGATATAAGKVGQAFSFDGVNDFVGLGTWSAGVQWTLEAWVNPASVPANRRAILGGMNDCNDWALVLQDGKWGVAIKPSSGACTETVTSGVAAVANTWYHLIATNDGTTARIYVNGELKGSGAVAAGATGTTAGTYIGGNVCCTEFFPGLVDEATIYNRALALTEIQSVYNAGSAGKCKTTTGCAVKADYQLQNTLSSSVGTPPALTNLGSNTFGTATVDGASRTVLQFAEDNGVLLTPTTGVIPNQVYTVVVLFSFNEISGYRRILDFKNNAADTGLYNQSGLLVFFSAASGSTAAISANTFVQVVLTRDAAKNVVGYVNGVQQFSFVDSGDAAVIDTNNRLIFFRDDANSEAAAGSVARIRLYDCALTPAEVGGLDRVPGQTPTCPIITGLNVNRLCNPGAELGAGATEKSQVVPIPGWTTTSNFTATRYDADGSLTVEESQFIGGGTNFFYGGDVNASSTATQLVNVADEAAGIDAGQRTAQFQAYLGGFGGDNAGIRAEFLNAGGTVLGTALVLGPRSDDMQLLSTTGPVPAGTRTIRVTMTATRVAGDDNEGYFDNLSLVLTQSGTTTCPTVTNLSPSSGAVGSTVTISGTNFTGVTAVRFANNVNAQFTANSATQITATVPSGAVTGVITLSKTGCTDVQTVPFTVTTAGPCLDVVIASNLTAGTGTTLTVPITVSDTTGKAAIAYDATLTYDPAVLRLQNPPTDKTGTLSSNFTITTNIPAAGQLRISGFGSTALTGAGVLLNVKFDVLGAANACSNLSFTSFRFNEGTPCSTTTNGRACVTGGGIISGAVSYCITPKPVPGAALNVTGSSTTSATTNSSGNYTLPNLNSGNYTLTPAKTGDVNGLASFDAALVAQHVVGIITLNSCQQLAGDTSNNGELSSFDAALIAQYVVGINNAASIAGTWKFVPPTRTYTNLSSNQTNQNFDAVLVGDVSGNWAAGATAFDELARASSPAQQISLALPNVSATTGTSVTIPITVGDLTGKGVIAYDFDLVFDQTVLQAQPTAYDAANTLSSALTITANPQPGRLRVSAFGTQSLAGAGILLNLKFNVLGAGGTSSALTWQRFLLNETVQTNLTNGRVSAGYAVACVSAASFVGTALASESIVAGFGEGLATSTEAAVTVPLPTSLAGTTVRVRDSAGVERLAPLFFVSSSQVNYQVPPGTAAGPATLIINSGDGTVSTGTMQIARVMPGLFAANSNGMGVAAALALRVKADGSQLYELVSTYDGAQQRFVPLPLSLGPEGEQVYLILFGTGVRNSSSLANVQTRVGGTEVPVAFVGAVEGLVGLDQLNLGPLPRSLAGRGEVTVAVQVDGQAANVVTVSIR
jgi:uncharacterized protein (TIGR03437 family)